MRNLSLAVSLLCSLGAVACKPQAMSPARSPAAAAPARPELTGLWGVERSFGPQLQGTLVIDGRTLPWRGRIAGRTASVRRQGRHVSCRLGGGQGEFRGEVAGDSGEIDGQWIQPPGTPYDNAYATPVVLRRIASGLWRGQVTPLPETLSLYLDVTRSADGTLSGSFRNPQFNLGRDDPYAITVTGDAVLFTSGRDSRDRIKATYDPNDDALELRVPQLDARLRMTRRDRDSAPGFYPVTPPSNYLYRVPGRQDDGWETASLAAVGLNSRPIRALVERIRGTHYTGFHTPYIHSLLIARHGKLVLEEYFYGYGRDRLHGMRSASKTFAGTLVGLAIEHGAAFGLSTPVYSLFPEYERLANLDVRKRAITVKDLLTMTSGLACDDNDDASPGNEDRMQQQHRQPDWYRYALDLPMARAPGGDHAVYCSAGINLLGGIVRNTTKTPVPELFYQYIARPLEIRHYAINLMPTGAAYMGGGVEMRPRDQLKLGQVYLDRGVWNGRRVLPAGWVRKSLRVYSRFAPDHGYGFAWHVIDLRSGGTPYRIFEAGGNGGQLVMIIPKLDMVVGFTAGNYGDFHTWSRFVTVLVPKYVIPAAQTTHARAAAARIKIVRAPALPYLLHAL